MTDFTGAVARRVLPSSAYGYYQQAQATFQSPKGQEARKYATTMALQQLNQNQGHKDNTVMNLLQAARPGWYNTIRLANGNPLLFPFAMVFPDRLLAYRLAKASDGGVTKLKAIGILLAPHATSGLQGAQLVNQGKLSFTDLQKLNPLH